MVRMRRGLSNRVVGQAGEFAVCAQLGKMGLVATPFAGNVPEFDVVAIDKDLNCLPIQVKTSSGEGGWITGDIRRYCRIEGPTAQDRRQLVVGTVEPVWPDLVVVLVRLSGGSGSPDRFFVTTKRELWRRVAESHTKWLESHQWIRPRKHDSFHSAVSMRELDGWGWENQWDVVHEGLAAAAEGRIRFSTR